MYRSEELMHTVGYVRVSTKRQANEGVSLDVQRDRIEAFALENGWILSEVYIDRGASARDDSRPEFQRMLLDAMAKPAAFSGIIVYDRSRFYRNAAKAELTIRELRRNGIEIFSVTQPNGNDEAGDMVRQLIAVVDEHSSRETAKRVRGTMIHNAKLGFWNGAAPPYGYKTEIADRRGKKDKKRLAVDEIEAPVVELIFRLAEEGDQRSGPMGVKSIAEYLNTRGYRTRRGNLWHVGPLHGLLTNTVYQGEYTYNAVDSNTRIKRPKEDHIVVACPAIIAPRRFAAVQASLRSRNPKLSAPRVVTGPILLTGLLQCAKCGGAMTMRTGKSGRYTYYACASRQARGTAACEGCSHPMRHVDEAVTEALVSEALTPTRLDGILRRIESDRRADRKNSAELLRMQAELANARQRINRLMTMVEQGLVEASDPELGVKLTAAQKDRDIAAAGIERVRRLIGPELELEPERIVAFSNYMKDRVRNGDIPFRKAYIRSIIDHIVIGDTQATLSGRRDGLRALVATHNGGGQAVPTGIQEWCTRLDSNCGEVEQTGQTRNLKNDLQSLVA
ncbi:MAG TPA: recombinase family protein [Aurantimonas coralicida]|uniref:Recombinase family protein n=2 Tax=root TaxID=1 RepID=A0A9C9NE41_9HYPH|nr:recombinase family protein [Aurantimonas coralicida]HET99502.1 recombinase family protein [Aurantimonas coralicida]